MDSAVILPDEILPPAARQARTERFSPVRFRAFRIDTSISRQPIVPIPLRSPPASLEEAVNEAKQACFHKDKLVVREANEITGDTMLHLYAVKKKSTPARVYRDYAYHNVAQLYVEPICALYGEALA